MFSQLYDFNLVCCAIATVSAAVGYRYTRGRAERRPGVSRAFDLRLPQCAIPRRRNSDASQMSMDVSVASELETSDSSSLDCPTPQSISDVTEPGSLKRKSRDEDERNSSDDGQADRSASICSEPPRKRCRTPSDINEQSEDSTVSDSRDDLMVNQDGPASPITYDSSEPMSKDSEASLPIASSEVSATAAQNSQIPLSFSIPACKPSSAFSAFAGASSAFAATTQLGVQKPAWCSVPETSSSVSLFALEPKLTPLAEPYPEATTAEISNGVTNTCGADDKWTPSTSISLVSETREADPLAAHEFTKSTHVGTTGEEDEDVKCELRGVKLFIKRGTGDFSTGMIGHVKLLSHKTEKSERLVFRREPVWKVSMCVGLRPAVRCSFDEEQGVLRVLLKETVSLEGDPDASSRPQVALYALKRGRVARDEFKAFAREVVQSMQANGS